MISVVVPMWNHPTETAAMLASCLPPPAEWVEIILVDNASTDPDCVRLVSEPPVPAGVTCRVLRNPVNVGYPCAINQGLAAARGDVLIIANNDIRFPPTGLTDLVAALRTGWDAVGPVSPRISGPQRVGVAYEPDAFTAAAAFWRARTPATVVPLTRLVGFCVALTRSALERLGGYDPRFTPGNYEDDDWAVRARLAGLRLGMAPHVLVDHVGGASFGQNPAYADLLARHQTLFTRKWRQADAATQLHIPVTWSAVSETEADSSGRYAVANLTAPDAGASAIAAATPDAVTVLVDPIGMPWPADADPRLTPWVESYPWPRFRSRLRAPGATWVHAGHPLEPVLALAVGAFDAASR